MPVIFGGKNCLEPGQELANCEQLSFPTDWWRSCNTYFCPLGMAPGHGRLLLLRADLDDLDLEATHDLVLLDSVGGKVTVKGLSVVRAFALTPGGRGDPNAAYWVEVRDRRHRDRNRPIDLAFNVPDGPGSSDYLSATLDSGSPWTWATMTEEIWAAVGTDRLGAWPGLPFTPDGAPVGWDFYGGNAWSALGAVLDRVGCALRLDPTTDRYSIVRLAATDTATSLTLSRQDTPRTGKGRLWDSDPIEPARGRLPRYVRVLFTKSMADAGDSGGSPYYASDQTDPTTGGALSGTEAGTYALLRDDLPALYDGTGTLTNAAALGARAAERAADFFRRARMGRLDRIYDGLPPTTGLLPGSQVKEVRYYDRGGGVGTHVLYYPGQSDAPAPTWAGALTLAGDAPFDPPGMGPPGGPGTPGAPTWGGPAAGGPGGTNTVTQLLPLVSYWVNVLGLGGRKYESYFRDVDTAASWYFGGEPMGSLIDNTSAFLLDNLWALPYLEARGGTLDRIGLHVTVAQAGGEARVGVYENSSDTVLYPGARVLDSGVIDCSTTGMKSVTVSQALPPGLYWLAFVTNNSSISFMSLTGEYCWPILGQSTDWGAANTRYGWSKAFTYAALPTPYPAGANIMSGVSTGAPKIGVRYGS